MVCARVLSHELYSLLLRHPPPLLRVHPSKEFSDLLLGERLQLVSLDRFLRLRAVDLAVCGRKETDSLDV